MFSLVWNARPAGSFDGQGNLQAIPKQKKTFNCMMNWK
jgi:hypothetical protein